MKLDSSRREPRVPMVILPDCENSVARGDDGLIRDQARMLDVDDGGVTNQYVRRTLGVRGCGKERRCDSDES
jgi:hypothetical protein